MDEHLQYIPLNEIHEPRIALRPVRRESPEYVEMVESMKKDGVLQPLLLRPIDGHYEPVEGRHRYAAAKEAGLTAVPAQVREMTDDEVLVCQLKCNAIRPRTASFEYARRLKLLMQRGYSMVELSRLVDKTPKWVSDQLHLNRVCPEARESVERGEIKMTSALALANLPADLQPKFIEDAIAMPIGQFKDRAEAANRDFKAFLLQEQQENREIGAANPKLRAPNVLKREVLDPQNAHDVLKAVKAKTPLDGWEACMAWIFRLDPISVENRKTGRKEKDRELIRATNEEYRRMNREMIRKFVNPQSSTGDYKHG
ncbi:MAG: ParB/RepB/Spo0J family partition protein [Planctomycetota bacterium]|jgi:ParB family chromosome partitioning protein